QTAALRRRTPMTATVESVEFLTPWVEDRSDPSARVRYVRVDGRRFEVRNVSGAGWYLHVRPAENRWFVGAMANWNDWAGVAAAARKCVADEAGDWNDWAGVAAAARKCVADEARVAARLEQRLAMRRPCEGCGAAPYEACDPFCLSHEKD